MCYVSLFCPLSSFSHVLRVQHWWDSDWEHLESRADHGLAVWPSRPGDTSWCLYNGHLQGLSAPTLRPNCPQQQRGHPLQQRWVTENASKNKYKTHFQGNSSFIKPLFLLYKYVRHVVIHLYTPRNARANTCFILQTIKSPHVKPWGMASGHMCLMSRSNLPHG